MDKLVKEMQRVAYERPLAEVGQSQRPEYFRRYDRWHSVGLTLNK